jgi:hypothetical protein
MTIVGGIGGGMPTADEISIKVSRSNHQHVSVTGQSEPFHCRVCRCRIGVEPNLARRLMKVTGGREGFGCESGGDCWICKHVARFVGLADWGGARSMGRGVEIQDLSAIAVAQYTQLFLAAHPRENNCPQF